MGCDYYIIPVITIYYKNNEKKIEYLNNEREKGYNYSEKSTSEFVEKLNNEEITKIIYENNIWKIEKYDIPYLFNKSFENIVKIEKQNYYEERF